MAIKRAALSQFISLCNCLLLQLSPCFAHTHNPSSSWSPTILSNLHLNLCLSFCLSLHLVPQPFFLNPAVLSPLLYLDTLLLASPCTGSHLCTTDSLINPGFVLLQKGVGCPSGSTLIAVWEHRPGLLSTCLFSPLLYSSLILYPLSHPLALHHWCFSFECLIHPLIFTSFSTSPFYLYVLFLFSLLSLVLSCPLLRHHISL